MNEPVLPKVWHKTVEGWVFPTWLDGAHQGPVFTVADLKEGLRVAQEKPVFTGVNKSGTTLFFQMQPNGEVRWSRDQRDWREVEREYVLCFTDSELDAIANARRS